VNPPNRVEATSRSHAAQAIGEPRGRRNEPFRVIYEAAGDDRSPVVSVDVPVAQLVVKLWERKARLYGLDLERSAGAAPPITSEMLAEILWPDNFASSKPIDVDAEELPDEAPTELEAGSRADLAWRWSPQRQHTHGRTHRRPDRGGAQRGRPRDRQRLSAASIQGVRVAGDEYSAVAKRWQSSPTGAPC
jgi:hypothetical protein